MRVVIAEDGVLLREGLARLLADEGHEITASVSDALGLVEAVEKERPDVCIVDVHGPSPRARRASISRRPKLRGR